MNKIARTRKVKVDDIPIQCCPPSMLSNINIKITKDNFSTLCSVLKAKNWKDYHDKFPKEFCS